MTDDNKDWKPVEDPFLSRPLAKAIQHKGVPIDVLALREPNGGDLLAVGNPVNWDPFSDPPKITFDFAKVVKMLSRLSGGVSEAMIARMSPNDLTDVAWDIAGFFTPGMKAPKPSASDQSQSQAPSSD